MKNMKIEINADQPLGEVCAELIRLGFMYDSEMSGSGVGGGVLRKTGEMLKPQNDTIENMNPACAPCNTNKSSIPLERWRMVLTHYRDVQLLRDSTHARHLQRFGLLEIKTDPVVFFFEKYGGDQ